MSPAAKRHADPRVSRARLLRNGSTPSEKHLWRALQQVREPGFHFRRQATIGPYYVDVCCHAARLVIEVDGTDHGQTARRRSDAARTRFLESRGYAVLRFWNNEVFASTEAIVELILETTRSRLTALGNPPPPLTPPRRKRGEGKRHGSAPTRPHA